MIAIFAGAAWLFWVNSENNLEKIQAMGAVDDKGHVLSKDQRKALIDISRIYKEDFGLVLKVRSGLWMICPWTIRLKRCFLFWIP